MNTQSEKPEKIRITRLTIAPEGEPIFSESATHVEIEDEASGEFIRIRQINDNAQPGEISIDVSQWPLFKEAVEAMISHIQS